MSESDIQNSFRHLQEDVVGNLETEERLAEITQRRGGMRPAVVAFAGGAAVVLIIGAALFAFRSSGNTATLPPATGTAAPETTSALSTTTLAPTTTTPSTAATTTTVGTPTTEAVPLDPQLTEIDSALRAAAAATLDAPEVTSLALYYGEGGAFTTSLWIDHRANGDSFVFDAHAGGTDAATLIVDGERYCATIGRKCSNDGEYDQPWTSEGAAHLLYTGVGFDIEAMRDSGVSGILSEDTEVTSVARDVLDDGTAVWTLRLTMSGHARTFIWNIADDGFLTKFEIRSDDGTLLDGVNTRVVNEIARGATDRARAGCTRARHSTRCRHLAVARRVPQARRVARRPTEPPARQVTTMTG